MADVIFKRGTKAEVDIEPISDGKILFTTDQEYNSIYTDVETNRIKIGGQQDVDSELSDTSINPVQNKIVNGAVENLQTEIDLKQSITDSNLTTTNKTVVGGINELVTSVEDKHRLTQLYGNYATQTTISLLHPITDYQLILVSAGRDGGVPSFFYTTLVMPILNLSFICSTESAYVRFLFTNTSTISVPEYTTGSRITGVYGIK